MVNKLKHLYFIFIEYTYLEVASTTWKLFYTNLHGSAQSRKGHHRKLRSELV